MVSVPTHSPDGSHRYQFPRDPSTNPKAIVAQGPTYRLTALTSCVLRYEFAADGQFEDRASTFALNRNLPVPKYEVKESENGIEIRTFGPEGGMLIWYDRDPSGPTSSGLQVTATGEIKHGEGKWSYGQEEKRNLGGTARTLDEAQGRIPLENGVLSSEGYATIDDSATMLFEEDGWVGTRQSGKRIDLYVFAHARNYRSALRDFFTISGRPPLIPRWTLGNWWSRYYVYTAESYIQLMQRFKDEQIPLSVAVIDMDWHIVKNVPAKYGNGWTGYTWERELFPDPEAFLGELHKRGLRTTLNLHPAHGVRAYEEAYPAMCKALGRDPSKEEAIEFDVTDRKFFDAYFDVLHRKLEDEGVDFWWIDFQQGEDARKRGIKNLFMLNHFHFLDSARDSKRPITFSRFGGPGSQRYPVGFSGDTLVTWESLAFQPEFTATASNIGYGWWSNDIGGHMFGYKDDELMARWTQLAIFSPILRLHSNENPFNTKEPWTFERKTHESMAKSLRLRHRLIPYIYSENRVCAQQGSVLISPMYYDYPNEQQAYKYPNQFFFGSQLLVWPIVTPADARTKLAPVKGWLPEGTWVDVFTGMVYDGDRELTLYRNLDDYPVMAKLGAIVALDANLVPDNETQDPGSFELLVVVGADGEYTISEDDGKGSDVDRVQWRETKVTYEQSTGTLSVKGDRKTCKVTFVGVDPKAVKSVKGGSCETSVEGRTVSVKSTSGTFSLSLGANASVATFDVVPSIWAMLDDAQVFYETKRQIYNAVKDESAPMSVKVARVQAAQGAGTVTMWDEQQGQPEENNLKEAVIERLLSDHRLK